MKRFYPQFLSIVFLSFIAPSISIAQSDQGDTGCGPTSLQSIMESYEMYVLDQGAGDPTDQEISAYDSLGAALQKLFHAGLLGDPQKMPETLLGESADAHADWQGLFSDNNASLDDSLLSISASDDSQAALDGATCRDIGDICSSIAELKPKALKAPSLKLLNTFLNAKVINAYAGTDEVAPEDLASALQACKKASTNLTKLLKSKPKK